MIGAGPAGLACAQQLNRAGHTVTVYERDEAAGGLVRFGVPDFKIEKWLVERRVQQLVDEGVEFRYGVNVGVDIDAAELRASHDAVVISTGARVPRDLPLPGRELDGVHFAMEYLYQRNRFVAGAPAPRARDLGRREARDRDRRRRHRRRLRRQRAPRERRVGHADRAGRRAAALPPRRDHAVAALADEAARLVRAERGRRSASFSISTTHFSGNGRVKEIHWAQNTGTPPFAPVEGTEESRPADLVLLAMGFLGPEQGLLEQLGVERDPRSNARRPTYATSVDGVFAAGDARRGQSLIVWAINEGRQCAKAVDDWLARPAG